MNHCTAKHDKPSSITASPLLAMHRRFCKKIGLLPRKNASWARRSSATEIVSVGTFPNPEKTVLKKLFEAISIANEWSWRSSAQRRSRPCPVPRSQTIILQVVYCTGFQSHHTMWKTVYTRLFGKRLRTWIHPCESDWIFEEGHLCQFVRKPMPSSNFDGTFDQLFLWIFLCRFYARCLSTSSTPGCNKKLRMTKNSNQSSLN